MHGGLLLGVAAQRIAWRLRLPSILLRVIPLDPANVGSAVLMASVSEATPATRSVLIRAAKILASVSGTIAYR